MKFRFSLIALIGILLVDRALVGGAETPSVRIARFDGNRAAAISYTFDDNIRDQYTLAVPMLDEFGFKGTFFVIAGKTAKTPEEGARHCDVENVRRFWGGISWPELKEMSGNGHEIANHTWSHPALTKLSSREVDEQIGKASEVIASHIGEPPLTIAFPGNSSNPQVREIALKHHVAYRAFQQSTKGSTTAASLNTWADKLVRDEKWGVLMTHGIEEGYAAMSSREVLHEHLKYVKSHEQDIWVDTFANVSRYEKERENAKLSASGEVGKLTCTLTSALDPQLYNVPLTLVIEAANATTARAMRGDVNLSAVVEDGTILIEATPSSQAIIITWK
ncbi:polysaccharide deacetylase family protein [Roseibacillus ishigakijimensis]|uniref:Polysaccharide deacetylase family protein n=1 Tax=Roseibacillus ishigakijimensis TaxID=454146 RepID=A0A934RSX7_9BACT|nr:polysaccharide deacetylase family protein [Roseibacillus ishigakijimensis]MBK1835332.1 polysaccharide deacetylase family protein [Roseibacillus ishigakijimensis]